MCVHGALHHPEENERGGQAVALVAPAGQQLGRLLHQGALASGGQRVQLRVGHAPLGDHGVEARVLAVVAHHGVHHSGQASLNRRAQLTGDTSARNHHGRVQLAGTCGQLPHQAAEQRHLTLLGQLTQ